MKNKNNVKDLISILEDSGESPQFIIGWLSSMIQSELDGNHGKYFTMQDEVNSGIAYYKDKALRAGRAAILQKVCNEAKVEDLYA